MAVNFPTFLIFSSVILRLQITNGENITFAIEDVATVCQKPDFQDGFCLPMEECSTLKRLDSKFQQFIKDSKCKKKKNTYCCTPEKTPDIVLKNMMIPCATIDSDDGVCVRIQECPELYDALTNSQMKTNIKNSLCSVPQINMKFPIVCCRTKKENTSEIPTKGLFPKTCGKQNVVINQRIIGGKEAQIGQFPWLAIIMHMKNKIKHFGCTGSLISTKFVLTAAHCLSIESYISFGPWYSVILGEHNRNSTADCDNNICASNIQEIRIKKILHHPQFDSTHLQNDIGLIQLKEAARLNYFVTPICLFAQNDPPVEYFLSGWGTTNQGSTSMIKLVVAIPPYNIRNCRKKYAKIGYDITEKQLCAGGLDGKDSCSGDSGGPLMYTEKGQWFAAGVVSYGNGCGKDDWPGVYTKINSYQDWITNNVARMNVKQSKSKTK